MDSTEEGCQEIGTLDLDILGDGITVDNFDLTFSNVFHDGYAWTRFHFLCRNPFNKMTPRRRYSLTHLSECSIVGRSVATRKTNGCDFLIKIFLYLPCKNFHFHLPFHTANNTAQLGYTFVFNFYYSVSNSVGIRNTRNLTSTGYVKVQRILPIKG